MQRHLLKFIRSAIVATLIASPVAAATPPPDPTAPVRTLKPFSGEPELAALLRQWADEAERRRGEQRARRSAGASAPLAQAVPAGPAAPAALAKEESVATADSLTNVQHVGVDEGGIVKLHGDHLVILRRGRLFTVRVGDDELRPVAVVDAWGPGVDPAGAWYDEILIAGDTVVVIGFSGARGGTEIGLFDISSCDRHADSPERCASSSSPPPTSRAIAARRRAARISSCWSSRPARCRSPATRASPSPRAAACASTCAS
jgi:hypothetical protein